MEITQISKLSREEWGKKWTEAIAELFDFQGTLSYSETAERFRKLLKTGLLRQTDLRDNPDRFFQAHRLIGDYGIRVGPGVLIRFTVQYNLFCGTIVALGTEEQVESLNAMQAAGKLGCFGLTEKFAGVNSGLVVQTTAEWDETKQQFRINSPIPGSEKNWISQGCTADVCVVVADLKIKGKSYGPHAFLMDFRRDGKLVDGITIGDMGIKTIGNDLDNAWIRFTDVWIPKSALLSRYCTIEGNEYIQKNKDIRAFDMIGQRLYTGRMVIATSAVVFTRMLFKKTKDYSDQKKCWAPDGKVPLSSIPQLKALFIEADQKLPKIEAFLDVCESQLRKGLETGELPSVKLIEAIAVAKVKAIELSIDLAFRLKQEVGSYALMGGTGFDQIDFLLCCKFAEGDSRILMQKIARDRMKRFFKEMKEGKSSPSEKKEAMLCSELFKAIKEGGPDQWNEQWTKVYDLAEAVIERTMGELVPSAKL